MPVYEVAVRFMRRAQVKEYEPAEAEVSFKANLEEGEDHLAVANGLMADAKSVAIESGLKAGKATATSTEAAPAAATSTEAPKNKGGRPPKQTLTPPAEKTTAAAPAAKDEFDSPPAKPAETKPAAPAADDEFAAFDSAPAASAAPMTVKELQDWITAQMQAKKIEVVKVREILAKYGAARTADTKETDRAAIKADVEAALKK